MPILRTEKKRTTGTHCFYRYPYSAERGTVRFGRAQRRTRSQSNCWNLLSVVLHHYYFFNRRHPNRTSGEEEREYSRCAMRISSRSKISNSACLKYEYHKYKTSKGSAKLIVVHKNLTSSRKINTMTCYSERERRCSKSDWIFDKVGF